MELKNFLFKHGFNQFVNDYSVFYKKNSTKICIILVYVDDLLITGDDEETIAKLKIALNEAFTIKDLGNLRYFLGIEVARGEHGTMINQRKYAIDIVNDVRMEDYTPASFHFPKGIKNYQQMRENC